MCRYYSTRRARVKQNNGPVSIKKMVSKERLCFGSIYKIEPALRYVPPPLPKAPTFGDGRGAGAGEICNVRPLDFFRQYAKSPLYPPLLKGDFIIPLFVKEGLGEIFKGLKILISWQHPPHPNPPPPGGRGLIGAYAITALFYIYI